MTEITSAACLPRPPWNKGKITGPKPPLRPSHVCSPRACVSIPASTSADRQLCRRQGLGCEP